MSCPAEKTLAPGWAKNHGPNLGRFHALERGDESVEQGTAQCILCLGAVQRQGSDRIDNLFQHQVHDHVLCPTTADQGAGAGKFPDAGHRHGRWSLAPPTDSVDGTVVCRDDTHVSHPGSFKDMLPAFRAVPC